MSRTLRLALLCGVLALGPLVAPAPAQLPAVPPDGRTTAEAGSVAPQLRSDARERRQGRRVRRAVRYAGNCVTALPAAERRVLRLRAAFGRKRARTRARVARVASIPEARVGRLERRGLQRLRAARRHGCAADVLEVAVLAGAPASAGIDPRPQTLLAMALFALAGAALLTRRRLRVETAPAAPRGRAAAAETVPAAAVRPAAAAPVARSAGPAPAAPAPPVRPPAAPRASRVVLVIVVVALVAAVLLARRGSRSPRRRRA